MTLCTAMTTSIHNINSKRLAQRLVRSLSVENENSLAKTTPLYQRTKSLYGKKKRQHAKYLQKEFCFLAIETSSKRYYSTKKPYPFLFDQYALSHTPSNYKPICIQLLARHGSRSLNSHDYDLQTLRIWNLAKDNQMLTSLGKELKIDIELFMHANNHVG